MFASSLNFCGGFGFEINPYDRCVANKMIEGPQYTIDWYVDNNQLLHKI